MSFSAESILKQYSLITTGTVTVNGPDINGDEVIGGNLYGGSIGLFTYGTQPADPTLYLYGSDKASNINNSGTIDVAGSHGKISGGTVKGAPPNPLTDYTQPLIHLSSSLAGDATTSGAGLKVDAAAGQELEFYSGSGVNGLAVLNISIANLNKYLDGAEGNVSQLGFNVKSGVTFVVNVTGTGSIDFPLNPDGTNQPDVLFNFVSATSVAFSTHWYTSVLAPDATVVLDNDIDGTLFAKNVTVDGEIHAATFGGSLCYAAGSRILTAAGERAVETLRAGDMVLAGCERTARPVKWVGRRRIDVAAHPRAERVAPIRIEASAFADNVPHRDLLVSPDHAILADGVLICARQLMNGTTIRQDIDCRWVEYFHVELDSHDILLAEGLAAESYLDTGNRSFFSNAGGATSLFPDLTDEADRADRESMSCAPFVWDAEQVKPVWQRLADRAALLGRPVAVPDTTAAPGLCLVAGGRTRQPIHEADGLYTFVLPRPVRAVRLVSRANTPGTVRPWMEDQRRLGAYVERITIGTSDDDMFDMPVDHPALSEGWWAVERDGEILRRWTDGDALLPLGTEATMVRVRIAKSSMVYLRKAVPDRIAA